MVLPWRRADSGVGNTMGVSERARWWGREKAESVLPARDCSNTPVPVFWEAPRGYVMPVINGLTLRIDDAAAAREKIDYLSEGVCGLDMLHGLPHIFVKGQGIDILDIPISYHANDVTVWDTFKFILRQTLTQSDSSQVTFKVSVQSLGYIAPFFPDAIIGKPGIDVDLDAVPVREALCLVASKASVDVGFLFAEASSSEETRRFLVSLVLARDGQGIKTRRPISREEREWWQEEEREACTPFGPEPYK